MTPWPELIWSPRRRRYRRRRSSGLHPLDPGRRPHQRRQRREALALIEEHRDLIRAVAHEYSVPTAAVTGALLWDPCENPYVRPFLRLGPGRVYPFHLRRRSMAELVERSGLVDDPGGSARARMRRLREPEVAIRYIAAILGLHAANYLRIAGVDIGGDAGVLCTLYQGGNSEERARRLAERRRADPAARPLPAEEMGPWVAEHAALLEGLVEGCGARRAVRPAETAAPAPAAA